MSSNLLALAMAYPVQALLLAVVLWLLAIVLVLAIVSLSRPELPLHQWQDDDDQHRAVTRPAPLEAAPWGRQRGLWALKSIYETPSKPTPTTKD